MFVPSIAGVDDRAFDGLGDHGGDAGFTAADHQRIHAHRLDGAGGIQQGLTLAHARGAPGQVERVRSQSNSGEAEAVTSPRRVLEEQISDHPPRQPVQGADAARGSLPEACRHLQQRQNLPLWQALQGKEMVAISSSNRHNSPS